MLNIVLIVIHQSIRDYQYDRARPNFQRILLTMKMNTEYDLIFNNKLVFYQGDG